MSKNAIVTGGTRGIGKAISEKLNEMGYNVISCNRNTGDLSTDEGIDKLVNLVNFDIDVFVNNAAFTNIVSPLV